MYLHFNHHFSLILSGTSSPVIEIGQPALQKEFPFFESLSHSVDLSGEYPSRQSQLVSYSCVEELAFHLCLAHATNCKACALSKDQSFPACSLNFVWSFFAHDKSHSAPLAKPVAFPKPRAPRKRSLDAIYFQRKHQIQPSFIYLIVVAFVRR